MKNLRKLLIGAISLTIFTISAMDCSATIENVQDDGTYDVGPGGCVGK